MILRQSKTEVSEVNNPSHEKKTSNALKADRTVRRVTFNPNKVSPGETVPGSLALVFNLTVGVHANNVLVNNASRALETSSRLKKSLRASQIGQSSQKWLNPNIKLKIVEIVPILTTWPRMTVI